MTDITMDGVTLELDDAEMERLRTTLNEWYGDPLRDRMALALAPALVTGALASSDTVAELIAIPATVWTLVDAILEARG